MAENEYLSLRSSRRWRPVFKSVCEGGQVEEIAEQTKRCVRDTLRKVLKLIPFKELLDAACNNPEALPGIIKTCKKGRDYARLFEQVAEKGASRETIIGRFQNAICESFFEQIRQRAVLTNASRESPSTLRGRLKQARDILQKDFQHIAANLSKNPDARICLPRGKKKTRGERAKEVLSHSLFGGRK